MYDQSARAYDLLMVANGKNYRAEAESVRDAIRSLLPPARRLLDVACGTGGHLQFLAQDFEAEGVDASEPMLAIAREKLNSVPLHRGDMRTFRLGKAFDAITCLFSSIGYLLPESELQRAITNMASHLVDGGVLIVEPWIHPDNWIDGSLNASAATSDDLSVARVVRSTRSGTITTVEMRWALASHQATDAFAERHVTALYTAAQYEDAFRQAGLTVTHDPVGLTGRGLFVATKAVP